jgi:hypothetical protein
MLFHRRHRNRIQRGILALACCALVAPPAASADKIGDTPADFGKPVTPAARIGVTPTDLPTAYGGPPVAAVRGAAHDLDRATRAHGRARRRRGPTDRAVKRRAAAGPGRRGHCPRAHRRRPARDRRPHPLSSNE